MSNEQEKQHVKILVEINRDDGSVDLEGLWAIPTSRGYRIDNIPFYATGIACNDEVSAFPAIDGLLYLGQILQSSGHSTIRLWFANEADVMPTRQHLRQLGCSSELDLVRLVAVDVPPTVSYPQMRKYLEALERNGILEYEEACLAQ